jgi:hypothetical protein
MSGTATAYLTNESWCPRVNNKTFILLVVVCGGVAVASTLTTLIIKKLKLDVSTALPTTVSIISLAATVFFGIVGTPLPGKAAGGGSSPTSGPVTPTASALPSSSPTVPAIGAQLGPTVNSTFIEGASDTPYAGKCVDVRGPSTAPDTPAQIWACEQVDEMRWQLTSAGEIQGYGGNCLTVADADADATPVLMEPCRDTPDQQWQPQSDGHISYTGGRCLDIQGPSANSGTALQIWQCKNVPEELWQLAPAL